MRDDSHFSGKVVKNIKQLCIANAYCIHHKTKMKYIRERKIRLQLAMFRLFFFTLFVYKVFFLSLYMVKTYEIILRKLFISKSKLYFLLIMKSKGNKFLSYFDDLSTYKELSIIPVKKSGGKMTIGYSLRYFIVS